MKYISGMQALNIPCRLKTTGDWHSGGIHWIPLDMRESDDSVFKNYGIEFGKSVPLHDGNYPVANHIRAVLDMIACSDFSNARGMKNDYICCDEYTLEIFRKVLLLKKSTGWNEVRNFMAGEYENEWLDFLEGKNLDTGVTLKNPAFVPDVALDFLRLEHGQEKIGDEPVLELVRSWIFKDDLTDLIRILYLVDRHFDGLSRYARESIRDSFHFRNNEHIRYLLRTQAVSEHDVRYILAKLPKIYKRLGLRMEKDNLY